MTTKLLGMVEEDRIRERLVRKSLAIPSGWFVEVYFSKRNQLSFSSPLTGNTWTNSTDKVGRLESWSINEMEGFKQTANRNIIEVGVYDTGNVDADKDELKRKPRSHEQYYYKSVYVTREKALEWILEEAAESHWYEDIINEIEGIEQ